MQEGNWSTKCYIFSHNDDLDDSVVAFSSVYKKLNGNGLGFCIMPLEGTKIYIEGEQEKSVPERYICG